MTVSNPLITGGASKSFSSSSSNELTLYNVQSEDVRKSAGLIDLPMPTLDSDGKIVMDLMGTGREITVEGTVALTDVGASSLYKYAEDIVGLGNNTLIFGSQGTTAYGTYAYTPWLLNEGNSGTTTINVVISETSVKGVKGNPNSFSYSITMMEYGTLV